MNAKCVVAFLSLALCSASSARAETLDWIRQLGTDGSDYNTYVSADGLGSVYISGWTAGSLGVAPGDGQNWDWDAFISKYDASGTLEWTQQLGTSGTSDWDKSNAVSADGLGSVYIAGSTEGSLEGANAGGEDAFIAKYDASGTLEWTRLIGTSENDQAHGVWADGLGSVYISGGTGGSLEGANAGGGDAFIAKYDASGTRQWTRQLGTSSNEGDRVRVSADGLDSVYISGTTGGSLGGGNAGGLDAFIAKYDASGTRQWTRQLGTSSDDASRGVSADGLGNVYISGWTKGSLGGTHAGDYDAFVSKYDASGTLEWTRQLGTSSDDASQGMPAAGLGGVYISGLTYGSLGGANAGISDAFVSKYDASGTPVWTQQIGSSEYDRSLGVSADGLGSVYISGYTQGSLGGPYAGGFADVFVAKFTDLLGDVNFDGNVNGLDVNPFVDVLLNGTDDNGTQVRADMNSDGEVNGLDVDPFVAAVVGGVQQIPEPSTLLLSIVALGVVGGWRKWKRVSAAAVPGTRT